MRPPVKATLRRVLQVFPRAVLHGLCSASAIYDSSRPSLCAHHHEPSVKALVLRHPQLSSLFSTSLILHLQTSVVLRRTEEFKRTQSYLQFLVSCVCTLFFGLSAPSDPHSSSIMAAGVLFQLNQKPTDEPLQQGRNHIAVAAPGCSRCCCGAVRSWQLESKPDVVDRVNLSTGTYDMTRNGLNSGAMSTAATRGTAPPQVTCRW